MRFCACTRALGDGFYACEVCADTVASLALRAAGLHADLESRLTGRPSHDNAGRSATRVHADVTVDLNVAETRRMLTAALMHAAQHIDTRVHTGRSEVWLACHIARNRHVLARSLFCQQHRRELSDAVGRATRALDAPPRVLKGCPRCDGQLNAVMNGPRSVLVCSDHPDHCFGINDWNKL